MPGTPLRALASQPTGRRRCFDARDHVRDVERCLDDLGEQVLGIAVEHPSSGWHARHIENWPQDPEETAAELKLHLDVVVVYGDHSEDIGRDLSTPYAGPGQLRPLQELSPEGEHLMPRLATVLGGPLCSDFVIPEGLEPPLTLARIFILAAQNVQIWLSGTSSGFCPRSDQIGGSARGYLGRWRGLSAVPVRPIGWSPILYIYT